MPRVLEMTNMTRRHAAALGLVGWYLMMPPTQEQLDSTCRSGSSPSVMDHVAALVDRDDADSLHARRCDQERIEVVLNALLSAWAGIRRNAPSAAAVFASS